jgi:hypothetical protein
MQSQPLSLPDGLVAIVKRDCPTCETVAPALARLAAEDTLTVYSQDDPSFPEGVGNVRDDTDLETSWRLGIEIVPTLIRVRDGVEVERIFGWNRKEWQDFTGVAELGADLPENRPGCGSKHLEPGIAEQVAARFGSNRLKARRVEVAPLEDEMELLFDRGWTDGLPVTPPTEARVLAMLDGTDRDPGELLGEVPPDMGPCTIEKVAINAVMAGCRPEYFPVVIAAVEAALIPEFTMHGILATTMAAGPVVIVNGPVTKRIGMNSAGNALGQGNRANSSIGRALQLVIRNVGGGKPQGVDRAAFGQPGKHTFCFAEDESDPDWQTLAESRGVSREKNAVTLFAGDGVFTIVDQISREPESLARSLAAGLRNVDHPKLVMAGDAFLVISPEHWRVFHEAGWGRAEIQKRLEELLMIPAEELVRGANGIAEGIPKERLVADKVPKFRPGGLNLVRAGGSAGLFSTIITGWAASGDIGSVPVTKEFDT